MKLSFKVTLTSLNSSFLVPMEFLSRTVTLKHRRLLLMASSRRDLDEVMSLTTTTSLGHPMAPKSTDSQAPMGDITATSRHNHFYVDLADKKHFITCFIHYRSLAGCGNSLSMGLAGPDASVKEKAIALQSVHFRLMYKVAMTVDVTLVSVV
jgi:hypothetical protein